VIQGSATASTDSGNQHNVHGLHGLESLCKVFGSAEYLERKMSDWSDDVFFLEMWDELQDRARQNTDANGTVGRDLNTSAVASRTSSKIAQQPANMDDGDTKTGALFDETASAYRRLRLKAEDQINELLTNAIITSLRPYTKITGWASLSPSDTLTPTSTLDPTLHLLSTFLPFLAKCLAPSPLRRAVRHLCLVIQKYLLDKMLLHQSFSTSGAAQFKTDVTSIERVVDACTRFPGDAARAMDRLKEGIQLLGLPIEPTGQHTDSTNPSPAKDDPDVDTDIGAGWGFETGDTDEDEDEDTGETDVAQTNPDPDSSSSSPASPLSLWTVEKRLFASNESARAVLAQLGFDTLSETEARAVLRRRVEVAG
jgi:RAD50-interacting protein 1